MVYNLRTLHISPFHLFRCSSITQSLSIQKDTSCHQLWEEDGVSSVVMTEIEDEENGKCHRLTWSPLLLSPVLILPEKAVSINSQRQQLRPPDRRCHCSPLTEWAETEAHQQHCLPFLAAQHSFPLSPPSSSHCFSSLPVSRQHFCLRVCLCDLLSPCLPLPPFQQSAPFQSEDAIFLSLSLPSSHVLIAFIRFTGAAEAEALKRSQFPFTFVQMLTSHRLDEHESSSLLCTLQFAVLSSPFLQTDAPSTVPLTTTFQRLWIWNIFLTFLSHSEHLVCDHFCRHWLTLRD